MMDDIPNTKMFQAGFIQTNATLRNRVVSIAPFLKAEILPTLITLDCLPIFFGHSSISMTVDVYGHWVPGAGREGLEAALTGGSSEDFLQKPVRKLRTIACKGEYGDGREYGVLGRPCFHAFCLLTRSESKDQNEIENPTLRSRQYHSPCRSRTAAVTDCAGSWG
jgi:hypothetical protein